MKLNQFARSFMSFVLAACVCSIPSAGQPEQLPRLTVATDGHADFQTLQEAVDHVASGAGAVILISPGTYHEKVSISSANIVLVGLGSTPAETVITWGDSAKNTGSTFKSGTITVHAAGFKAENLSIVNSWWDEHPDRADASQAVALQLEGDKAVLDRVRIISGQDTLFANSSACHGELTEACSADRQFFNDCYIEGHVDYIFGEAKAVFEACEFHSRPHSNVMITAQSRHSLLEDSAYYMLHCRITGNNDGSKVVLGRPWRDDATVTFYATDIEQNIEPAGWSEWGGRLKTATYREYKSTGPGASPETRIVDSPVLTTSEEMQLNPGYLLAGSDHWNPEKEIEALRMLVKSK